MPWAFFCALMAGGVYFLIGFPILIALVYIADFFIEEHKLKKRRKEEFRQYNEWAQEDLGRGVDWPEIVWYDKVLFRKFLEEADGDKEQAARKVSELMMPRDKSIGEEWAAYARELETGIWTHPHTPKDHKISPKGPLIPEIEEY